MKRNKVSSHCFVKVVHDILATTKHNTMSLSSLPPETLHNIFSYDGISRTDLCHLSLVSRNIWEVATSFLYSNLDIHVNSEYTAGVWMLDKRYQNIVQSIASYVYHNNLWSFPIDCFQEPHIGLKDSKHYS
jgi:hypothetical protein